MTLTCLTITTSFPSFKLLLNFEMPAYNIKLLLKSRSQGEIFRAKHKHLESGIKPKVRVDNHLFAEFWNDHLTELSSKSRLYEPVIDAFIALALGKVNWRFKSTTRDEVDNCRNTIRTLLKDNPPNLVLVAGVPNTDYYGIHYRQSNLWQYICLNEFYVNAFIAATTVSERLSYAAVMNAAIDHELSHWLVTLVSPYEIFIFCINKNVNVFHVVEIRILFR